MTYLETAAKFYSEVAESPQRLKIPEQMQEMNYGCGTTVHAAELVGNPVVLYVGVGGGLEALQFAYFSRQKGAVIAVDPVSAMRDAAARNLQIAAQENDWFDANFVEIREGDAFALPVPDASVDVVAQNCLFNIFEPADLTKALTETYRVLKPGGRLLMSDPIATRTIPQHLKQDERLRALCLSGALTYAEYVQHLVDVGFGQVEVRARRPYRLQRLRALCLSGALTYAEYVQHLVDVGFGQVEVRARRPYRLLDKHHYQLEADLLLESLDSVSFKVDVPDDGACIFTGKTAIYRGMEELFDDGAGHVLQRDKTAGKLGGLIPDQVLITDSTWHYNGGGCC